MDKYNKIKELSPEAYDFVMKILAQEPVDGRHDITDSVFANMMSYETKKRKDLLFEAHKKYIDVQIMIKGSEIITVEHIDDMHKYDCIQPFGDGDAELFACNTEGTDHVLNEGDYIILYPEDAHMPCICINQPENVRKAVIKIPV